MIGRSGLRLRSWFPAKGGVSLLEHVRVHLPADGSGIDEAGLRLPDEKRADPGEITWAPGARDGAFGHHFGGGGQDETAGRLARLVLACVDKPTRRRRMRLYSALEGETALDYVDPMIEQLRTVKAGRQGVSEVGVWLIETGWSREPVKVGIALAGAAGFTDPAAIRDLGCHDEFTLYSAVALMNGFADPEPQIWHMAKALDGWGRIHCVERLKGSTNPEIREWILREGFRNSVMYEYLAHIAATTGGLLDALRRDDVDRDLLVAAGEILQALIMGGPAEGIDDYQDAGEAVELFLGWMHTRADSIADHIAIAEIRRFLNREGEWSKREGNGWSEERRQRLSRLAEGLLADPAWEPRIREALRSDDDVQFGRATEAAGHAGLDIFDVFLARIESHPLKHWWFQAWAEVDEQRARTLIELARRHLDVDAIASGPSTAIGMGPGSSNSRPWVGRFKVSSISPVWVRISSLRRCKAPPFRIATER